MRVAISTIDDREKDKAPNEVSNTFTARGPKFGLGFSEDIDDIPAPLA